MVRRLAFVVPRYGEQVLGGAEAITRKFAERLPRDRFAVDVLTTCAVDLQHWENVLPPGRSELNNVNVYRFPVAHQFRSAKRYSELLIKFNNRWPHSVDEEYEWIDNNAHSPELYAFIQAHHQQYDLLIFGPYLFGITYYGMTIAPDKSVLWPHLHDEAFAKFHATRLMMTAAKGIQFNCEPEMSLAQGKLAIFNRNMMVVGEGIEPASGDADRFREETGISGPFILYAGRLDSMKNVLELTTFFMKYKDNEPSDLKLVLIGKGPLQLPRHPDILPLGYVSDEMKWDAMSAADILVQPSKLESFSLVIMEAWLTGTPVLVHGDCDVTRHHVVKSNGGLYYGDYDEFVGVMNWFYSDNQARSLMGLQGQTYVRDHYNWPGVIERFSKAVELWIN